MRNPFFYVLLIVLVVLDGWLLSHPNLVGRAGVFFFDYTYLETFPKALATVAVVVGLAQVVAWFAGRLGQAAGIVISVGLLAASVFWLFQSYGQYNTGVYKLTGAGFRAGAILLPGLLALVFANAAWKYIGGRKTK
ncbi:hypothetical protein [Spirosoma pomorum]